MIEFMRELVGLYIPMTAINDSINDNSMGAMALTEMLPIEFMQWSKY